MGWSSSFGRLGQAVRNIGRGIAETIRANDTPLEALGLAPEGSKLNNMETIAMNNMTQALESPSFQNMTRIIDPALSNLYVAISGDEDNASMGLQGLSANSGIGVNQLADAGAILIGGYMLGADPGMTVPLALQQLAPPPPEPTPPAPATPLVDNTPVLPEFPSDNKRSKGRRNTILAGGLYGGETLGGGVGYQTTLGS